ncbi:hypothetical protein FIBSPDRAFT_864611 [Athelia psychrophila]|uniref:DUF6533 domain-containing protein n=1 Tax=Athelia psychrophila TaxID=1759441 RepID=A0A166GFW9_9AGAM|nr:hypothetical protein FIBSPDRAFT_864611 [Fibularhizoctonia sp. CBS 109695]
MPENTILLGAPDRSTLLKMDQVGRNITVACLCLCIWDWLISIPDEVEIARRVFTGGSGRLGRGVNIVYFVCRFSTLATLLAGLLMELVALNSCAGLAHTMSVLFAIAQPATALLFYSRVSAIYLHEKRVVIFFGIFWLTIWGCFLADAAYTSLNIGRIIGTGMCGVVKASGGSSCIIIAVYDTFVYMAISWRLSSLSLTGGHWKARLASLATGAGLYRLSKSLLRQGQLYYFTTVGIIVTIAVFSTGVSPYINGQFIPFGYVIPTIMTCRLFRETRISAMSDNDTLPTLAGVSSALFAPHSRNEHDHLSRSDDIHVEYEMEAGATSKSP